MISIRLNKEDEQLVKKYAEMHNISISELFKNTVIKRIEDDIDLQAYNDAMEEFNKDPITYTLEEIESELDE